MGVNSSLFSDIVTELPTPKFSTTVPPALTNLRVTLPLPALICWLNVNPIPVHNVTVLSF